MTAVGSVISKTHATIFKCLNIDVEAYEFVGTIEVDWKFPICLSGPISGNQPGEKKKKEKEEEGLSGLCKMAEQMGQMAGKAQEFWIPFLCSNCWIKFVLVEKELMLVSMR